MSCGIWNRPDGSTMLFRNIILNYKHYKLQDGNYNLSDAGASKMAGT